MNWLFIIHNAGRKIKYTEQHQRIEDKSADGELFKPNASCILSYWLFLSYRSISRYMVHSANIPVMTHM